MEFEIPAPGPDGVRRIEFPFRVKLFLFWVTLNIQLWLNEKTRRGGIKVR